MSLDYAHWGWVSLPSDSSFGARLRGDTFEEAPPGFTDFNLRDYLQEETPEPPEVSDQSSK